MPEKVMKDGTITPIPLECKDWSIRMMTDGSGRIVNKVKYKYLSEGWSNYMPYKEQKKSE